MKLKSMSEILEEVIEVLKNGIEEDSDNGL